MKKMIMFAVAILSICTAHAAHFNWAASSFMYKGFLADETPVFQYVVIDLGTSPNLLGISFANGELKGGGSSVATGTADMYNAAGYNLDGTAGHYYTVAIFHEPTGLWGIGDAKEAKLNPTDQSGQTIMDMLFDKEGVIDPYGWEMPGVMADKPSNVPEPTSMALLILGAAVFGLRRKIRC